jgi:hypothetical protein
MSSETDQEDSSRPKSLSEAEERLKIATPEEADQNRLKIEDQKDRTWRRVVEKVRVSAGILAIGIAQFTACTVLIIHALRGEASEAPQWASATLAAVVTAAVAYVFRGTHPPKQG